MTDPIPTPQAIDFVLADFILEFMGKNREIEFQTHGSRMDRATAQKHFNERAALVLVRKLVIAEIERLAV